MTAPYSPITKETAAQILNVSKRTIDKLEGKPSRAGSQPPCLNFVLFWKQNGTK